MIYRGYRHSGVDIVAYDRNIILENQREIRTEYKSKSSGSNKSIAKLSEYNTNIIKTDNANYNHDSRTYHFKFTKALSVIYFRAKNGEINESFFFATKYK